MTFDKTIALEVVRNALFEARRLGCTDADIANEVKLSETQEVWPDLTEEVPPIGTLDHLTPVKLKP